MRRRWVWWVVAVAAVAGVAAALLWRPWERSQQAEVRSVTVERGTMVVAVTASGSIAPEQRASLAFETPGRVAEVLAAPGDAVSAGDALARLDTGEMELQVYQARAALAAAEAQLLQLEEGPRPGEVAAAQANLQATQARLSGSVANRDQTSRGPSEAEIASAQAQVSAAQLQLKVAEESYNEVMKSTGDETRREQAAYELYVAREALKAAEAQLAELEAGAVPAQVQAAQADVWASVAQRDAAQANLDLLNAGPRPEQVASVEAQVRQARTALKLAELTLERTTLRAPFDGVVASVNAQAGEIAPVGVPVIVLLDVSRFLLPVHVDELDVGQLSVGQPADVEVDAFPDAVITGVVERIAPVATSEAGVVYYQVVIGLAEEDAPIRADMTANATIVIEELDDVLRIPSWVVRVDQQSGQTYVERQSGEEIERVDVTLGVRYEGMVQVLDGLSEGDELVWAEGSSSLGLDFGAQ